MTTVIWLGILAWVVLAMIVGLTMARMINLRDRQCPGSCEHERSGASKLARESLLSRIASSIRGVGKP